MISQTGTRASNIFFDPTKKMRNNNNNDNNDNDNNNDYYYYKVEHNRPDLVVVDKQQAVCQIIDVAAPGDARVELKEKEKIDKYQDLAKELRKLRKVKTSVAPRGTWDNRKRISWPF